MKVVLLTTLPNRVATTLYNLLGDDLYILDIVKVENKKDSIMKILRDYTPDTLITYRCPYILPIDILMVLPFGAYNIHPSLLPKYKGLNPWIEIFQNQDTKSGVTLHRITKQIDCGGIVFQEAFNIIPSDTIESARNKADELAAKLVENFIFTLKSNIDLLPLPNKFDYQEAITSRENLLFLKGNDSSECNGLFKEGAFCIVFQVLINGVKYAIRCWKCLNNTDKQVICRRMKLISDWIRNNHPSYLNEIFLFERGIKTIKGVYPIIVMKWYDDMSLKEYLFRYIQDSHLLIKLSNSFVEMISYFHHLHISHGDMTMDNIRVKTDGSLYLIDYDTFYVPTMKYEKDNVKGKSEYQHHSRNNNMYLSEYIDYYSEYIIYLTINSLAKYPELWNLLELSNIESHILTKDELSNIEGSRIYSFISKNSDEKILSILLYMSDMWENNILDTIIPIEKMKNQPKSESKAKD